MPLAGQPMSKDRKQHSDSLIVLAANWGPTAEVQHRAMLLRNCDHILCLNAADYFFVDCVHCKTQVVESVAQAFIHAGFKGLVVRQRGAHDIA